MPHLSRPATPSAPPRINGFAFAAISLGLCGLILFFWQPLALAISFCGFLLGLAACGRALKNNRAGLRLAIGSTCLCAVATFLDLAIMFGGRSDFHRPF